MKKITAIFLLCITSLLSAQTGLVASAKIYDADCELSAAKITVTGGVGPYAYQWSNGAIGDTASSLVAGNYSVHITDNSGLSTDVTFKIDPMVCTVGISNKFSPNGDGINDVWYISRTDMYPNFFLQVFDRWGQVVHQQRKQFVPWDGTHLGVKLPDATYYCVFYYEDGTFVKPQKASVTLVR